MPKLSSYPQVGSAGDNDELLLNVSPVESDSTSIITKANLFNGTQTIAGVKTFTSSPVIPDPTLATQAANKEYVDSQGLASVPFVTVGFSNADYICDGVADDVQILAAINSISGGGLVFIKPGSYSISTDMKVDKRGITIAGSGKGATKLVNNIPSTNTGRGLFYLFNSDGVTPVDNFTIRELSIDLNGSVAATVNGIHIRATTTGVTVSTNYLIEDVEIYNRGIDSTGSIGAIRISGLYNGFAGSLKNIKLNRVTIRDGVPTTMSNQNGHSVLLLTDDLQNFTVSNCLFDTTYDSTICRVSTGNVIRGPKNWLFTDSYFNNTMANDYFNVGTVDIQDFFRTGINGITISNCEFNWGRSFGADLQQYYCIALYQSKNVLIDNNIFKNENAVFAPGITVADPGRHEDLSWTFSNNLISDCFSFYDPDGHFAGNYTDNVFYNVEIMGLGGYGRHRPTVFDGNLFYNCLTDDNGGGSEYHYAMFVIEEGGYVVQNNVMYNDVDPSLSQCKYFVYELDGGSYSGYKDEPNAYRGNTIYGSTGIKTTGFYLNSSYKHYLQNNIGIPEITIQNLISGSTVTTTPLASTDIVSDNYSTGGARCNGIYSQGNVTGATTFTRSNGDLVTCTLTDNITVTLTSGKTDDRLVLQMTQDNTGNRTVTWPSNFKKAGGSLVLSTGANSVDVITMEFDGTNWREVSRSLNES